MLSVASVSVKRRLRQRLDLLVAQCSAAVETGICRRYQGCSFFAFLLTGCSGSSPPLFPALVSICALFHGKKMLSEFILQVYGRRKREAGIFFLVLPDSVSSLRNFGRIFAVARILRHQHLFTFACASRFLIPCVLTVPFLFFLLPGCNLQGLIIDRYFQRSE